MGQPTIETAAVSPPGRGKGRTVGIVGFLTLIVAIFGYLREASLAARFGVSTTMDAYFGAVFVPNIIYLILISGTLSPIFIPILLQGNDEQNPNKTSETFSVITNFVLLLFFLIVLCGIIAAPGWLPLLFRGFNPATAALAIKLVRIIFPAVLFLALSGILTAVLNAFHKFALAALAPALSSLAVMVAAILARGNHAVYWVGIATALGLVLQALLLIPAAVKLGIRYQLVFDFRHYAIKKLLRLGLPLLLYLVIANAAGVMERNFASRISTGSVSILTYALRLFTVPSNLLAAPLAVVAYPGFAREAMRKERGELSNQVSSLFRLLIFLFLPVTIWTILNALPITRLMYEHGHFSLLDSLSTSRILAIYSVGILPTSTATILLRCFFVIEDTITPLLVELVALFFFLLTAPYAMTHLGIAGLVMVRVIAFFLVVSVLIVVLWKRYALLKFDFGTLWFILRTAIAACGMALLCKITLRFLQPAFESGNMGVRLVIVLIQLGLGGGIFLLGAHILRLPEAKKIFSVAQNYLPGKYLSY